VVQYCEKRGTCFVALHGCATFVGRMCVLQESSIVRRQNAQDFVVAVTSLRQHAACGHSDVTLLSLSAPEKK
jgi:hypothetical protein